MHADRVQGLSRNDVSQGASLGGALGEWPRGRLVATRRSRATSRAWSDGSAVLRLPRQDVEKAQVAQLVDSMSTEHIARG